MKYLFSLLLLLLSWTAQAQVINTTLTPIPSAAITATATSADLSNPTHHGAKFIINVSAYTSGNITPRIQAPVPSSPSTYYDILVGTAISSTGTTVLKIGPGIAASSNAAAQDSLPPVYRVVLGGASSPVMTVSVDVTLE